MVGDDASGESAGDELDPTLPRAEPSHPPSESHDVTLVLSRIEQGEPHAAEQLLPLVYEELRKLAAAKMAREKPDQTLQATALVHEAYLRLVGNSANQHWNSRGHFFGAAAEAMRRILVEAARHKARPRHGGEFRRVPLDEEWQVADSSPDDLLDLDAALCRLESSDPLTVQLVKLRCFAGITMNEAAEALGLPLRSAERNWTYARTWLHRELSRDGGRPEDGEESPPKS